LTKLREIGVMTPVLMVTARDAVEQRVKGLSLGADDYIVKPFALSELTARIQTVMRRSRGAVSDELRYADLVLDRRRRKVTRGSDSIDLSGKEFLLLQLLLEHQGQVLSREFIAERVWDLKYEGESNVVDVNIRRLRAKIDDNHSEKLIHTVRGRGYVVR
jgi:two-component system copper resistance phosphate regulon response regulator CusR